MEKQSFLIKKKKKKNESNQELSRWSMKKLSIKPIVIPWFFIYLNEKVV